MINKDIYILERNEFPEKLKRIKNSPKRLYLIGDKKLIFEDSFAVIGTRKISEYGIMCSEKIVKELALRNIVITSGMAIGTDTFAHTIAINTNSKTIAVLGGGFNYIYPKQNVKLFEEIIENGGLIISEYQPDEKYRSKYFPERNRIVSAISVGVLVIEATYRSGTSITVRYAKEQGKKIFAIPGRIDSKYSYGVIITTEVEDILKCFPQFINKKRKTLSKIEKNLKTYNLKYEKIINILKDESKCLDKILMSSEFERTELINILFEMQLEGLIEERIGDGYVLKKR